ncbi:MAG: glutathione transferase [Myxococcaceae bacterium]|nr:glutathione transferase [Myxococcaceae bacterium]
MSEPLTLWVDDTFDSPWAFSAFIALTEKELPFTLRGLSLERGEHRRPGFGARTGRIPALQRGEYWLAESVAIAEYAAENFPYPGHPRLFPEDLARRGECREVQGYVRTGFEALRAERPSRSLWGARVTAPLSDAARADADALLAYAAGRLAPGARSLFGAWCIADADLALALQRLVLNGDEVPRALADYAAATWDRPSARAWHALERPAGPITSPPRP